MTKTCTICDTIGQTSRATIEIIRDNDRDGLGSGKVYACDACVVALGDDTDARETMGVSDDEYAEAQARISDVRAQLADAKAARSLEALAAVMDDTLYEALQGSYSDLPTWGAQTERVMSLIGSSCDSGDIASWDTRAADVAEHRYLMRETDCGVASFRVVTESEL